MQTSPEEIRLVVNKLDEGCLPTEGEIYSALKHCSDYLQACQRSKHGEIVCHFITDIITIFDAFRNSSATIDRTISIIRPGKKLSYAEWRINTISTKSTSVTLFEHGKQTTISYCELGVTIITSPTK